MRRWIEKNQVGQSWLALEGSAIAVTLSEHCVVITGKSLLPTYHSLIAP